MNKTKQCAQPRQKWRQQQHSRKTNNKTSTHTHTQMHAHPTVNNEFELNKTRKNRNNLERETREKKTHIAHSATELTFGKNGIRHRMVHKTEGNRAEQNVND